MIYFSIFGMVIILALVMHYFMSKCFYCYTIGEIYTWSNYYFSANLCKKHNDKFPLDDI